MGEALSIVSTFTLAFLVLIIIVDIYRRFK